MISSAALQHSAKQISAKCSHLLSVLSPLGLAALIGVAGVWAMESAPSQTFINTTVLTAHTGADIEFNVPIIVQTDTRKALYRISLSDKDGVVYQFPDQKVENPKLLDLTAKNIRIPDSIKPGVYTLNVQVIYPFNPFKNGNIFMTVGTLNVIK